MGSRKTRILITGSNGFIGSNLIDFLLTKNVSIVCLNEPGTKPYIGDREDLKNEYCCLTNKKKLSELFENQDFDYVYHLAALTVCLDLDKLYRVNTTGTKNIFELCSNFRKLKRFLFTSSIAAVGPSNDKEILTEISKPRPITEYGKSKLLAEKYILSSKKKIPFTIVRLPLVYGPRSRGGLYPLLKFSKKGIQPSFPGGETIVGYVKDIIEEMFKAATSRKSLNKVYFLGENKIYTFNEMLDISQEIMGRKMIRIKFPYSLLYFIASTLETYARITNTRPLLPKDDVSSYLKYSSWRFSASKAKTDLKYKTKYPFREGIKLTIDWYSKQKLI
ncbi:MAG: NAD(P)-dependent oxidoreductase [archaeon]|nr:MAG: NAD(P)-dependent oxidoreductase [archaeon]